MGSAASPGPARICRKNDKGTQGEPVTGRSGEGEGGAITCHLNLLSTVAAGNYQEAMGCPALRESQPALGMSAVLGASRSISSLFFLCDSPKAFPPPPYTHTPTLFPFRTESISLASNSAFKMFGVSHRYLSSLKITQSPSFPNTPLLTEINHHL